MCKVSGFIITIDQCWQTSPPITSDAFTQTVEKPNILRSKGNRNSSSSRSKSFKKTSIIPQTYRGGGFLYYSRSIEGDELSSTLQKPSYEDNHVLHKNQRPSDILVLNHPKMKGDNLVSLIKNSESMKKLPIRAKRFQNNSKQ